jgi:general L-amino acid transport system permease protein
MAGGQPIWTMIRSRRTRGLIAQLALIVIVGLIVWGAVTQAQSAIARQSIATGFAFLNNTAGFDISQHLIPYTEESTYFDALIVGLLNTLLVAALGIVFATIIGFAVGLGSLSRNWLVAKLCEAYVETLRNVPVLLQIFFWYFAVLRAVPGPRESLALGSVYLNNRGLFLPWPEPLDGAQSVYTAFVLAIIVWAALAYVSASRRVQTGRGFPVFFYGLSATVALTVGAIFVTGVPFRWNIPHLTGFSFEGGAAILPELIALVFALSLYVASYIAENVRAGVLGVAKGQTEAALALGLSRFDTLRLVIVPQAMRQIIPPLTSQYLNLTKTSSLAVAIAYPDLVSVFAGTTLNQTGQAIEVLSITMLIYLALSLMTSFAMNLYNAQIARTGQR